MVLHDLDLEPARPVLEACYADSPRGGKPRDPIGMLRCLLLAVLVGQPSLNRWVRDLRACRVLRVLGGLPEEDRGPGVGTYHGMLHRLHDGALRSCKCGQCVAPSEQERRRARSPQPPRCASTKPAESKRPEDSVTARLVAELRASRDRPNPTDLQGRLTAILLGVAVSESARRELLGDPAKFIACGDGSALVTGAAENGRKTCDHPRGHRCDCHRVWTDPDARIGYDSYREHFCECPSPPPDTTSPSRSAWTRATQATSPPGRGPSSTSRRPCANKASRSGSAGHDAQEVHRYFREHGVDPVIPLTSVTCVAALSHSGAIQGVRRVDQRLDRPIRSIWRSGPPI